MPKKGQYGVAPYISLDQAIQSIRSLHHQHGEKASKTFLADILGNSLKSSSFLKKLAALKIYGLISEANGEVRLTPLALNITAPTSPNEEEQAKVDAFFSVLLFKKLHEKLLGGMLPKSEQLTNFLIKDFMIHPKDAKSWAERFDESIHTVGLLTKKGASWMIVDSPMISQGDTVVSSESKILKEETGPTEGTWREYSHPMGKLKIRVDAGEDVVDEFINFLQFVVLKKKIKKDGSS